MGVALAWILISEPVEKEGKGRRKGEKAEGRGVPWGTVLKILLAVIGLARQLADLRRKSA